MNNHQDSPTDNNINNNSSSMMKKGCQARVGNGKCGETETLEIFYDFKKLYQQELCEIEKNAGGGDYLQRKIHLQEIWIENLTEQTEMLVKLVGELEVEATERVRLMEHKLQQNAHCVCKVMKRYRQYDFTHNPDESFQKVIYLENDVKMLVEFIRRVRDDGEWSINGLQFYDVSYKDLFGDEDDQKQCVKLIAPTDNKIIMNNDCDNDEYNGRQKKKHSDLIDNKDKLINDLQEQMQHLKSFGDIEEMSKQLKITNEKYESIRQTMLDMRNALTEEVACKHDIISGQKKELQKLEEQCLQADKQTAFKDDIIKELRKEIKQLMKQQKEIKLDGIATKEEEYKKQSWELLRQLNDLNAKRIEEVAELKLTIAELQCKLSDAVDQLESIHSNRNERKCKGTITTTSAVVVQHEKATMVVGLEQQMVTDSAINDKNIIDKEKIIDIQNTTLMMLQEKLEILSNKDIQMECDKEKRCAEIIELKCKITNLENMLGDSRGRAENLQKAVDLYLNSINLLESTEERAKIEIEQQRETIANLQQALVVTKQNLDELTRTSQEDVSVGWAARWLFGGTTTSKTTNIHKSVLHDI